MLDVAYEAGYFDQAHLTRSLKRLIGQTPADIIPRPGSLVVTLGVDASFKVLNLPIAVDSTVHLVSKSVVFGISIASST
ncbi:MAG: hypothetical protein ACRD7E_07755 [Bryobacteraceae bacterium]